MTDNSSEERDATFHAAAEGLVEAFDSGEIDYQEFEEAYEELVEQFDRSV